MVSPPTVNNDLPVEVFASNLDLLCKPFSSLRQAESFSNKEKHSILVLAKNSFIAYLLAQHII